MKTESTTISSADEIKINDTLVEYGVNVDTVGKEEGKRLFDEILEISQTTTTSLNESFEKLFENENKEKFQFNLSPIKENEKKTKLEHLRKQRKQRNEKIKERNSMFSPVKQKLKKQEPEKENVENLLEEKLFKYEKEEELKEFKFNISPLKSVNLKPESPKSARKNKMKNLNNSTLTTNLLNSDKKKKQISTSRMKLPTSMNKMKEKSRIPIKKESNLKTLHGKERLNLKSTALPFETKWKKYLQNK
eukprot:gene10454-2976_t